MRISGSGHGGGGGAKGSGHQRGNAFRRRHRIGERLSGRILRREAPGLAWVDFQGIELLAHIESDPEPGSTLLFQVMRLEPDLLLQELHVAQGHGDPLSPALHIFWAARSQFEAQSYDLRNALPPDATKESFLKALEQNPKARDLYEIIEKAREAVSLLTQDRDKGRVDYRPWIMPQAMSSEMLLREQTRKTGESLRETVVAFALPNIGQCEYRLLESGSRLSARLFSEHPDRVQGVTEHLTASLAPNRRVEIYAPAPLPKASRAGVLAPLLRSPSGHTPGFARQV